MHAKYFPYFPLPMSRITVRLGLKVYVCEYNILPHVNELVHPLVHCDTTLTLYFSVSSIQCVDVVC